MVLYYLLIFYYTVALISLRKIDVALKARSFANYCWLVTEFKKQDLY